MLAVVAHVAAEGSTEKTWMRQYWETNYDTGERAIFAYREANGDGAASGGVGSDKIRAICMAKGSGNTVLEP